MQGVPVKLRCFHAERPRQSRKTGHAVRRCVLPGRLSQTGLLGQAGQIAVIGCRQIPTVHLFRTGRNDAADRTGAWLTRVTASHRSDVRIRAGAVRFWTTEARRVVSCRSTSGHPGTAPAGTRCRTASPCNRIIPGRTCSDPGQSPLAAGRRRFRLGRFGRCFQRCWRCGGQIF